MILEERPRAWGTLGIETSGEHPSKIDIGHTTPDPVAVHEHLSCLCRMGVTHLALESSSHGLDQFRLDGVEPNVCSTDDDYTRSL